MTTRRAAVRHDRGETLVELLVTIVILGIAGVAILGATLIAVDSSVLHRSQAQAQAGLRSWAEQIARASYTECAGTSSFPAPSGVSSDFSWTVNGVQYWDGSQFVASCAGTDRGVQKVTLQVTVPRTVYPGFSQKLDVVVRKPCVSAC